MRTPLFALLAAVISAVALLAACGGDDDGPSPTPNGATATPGQVIQITALNNTFSVSSITVAKGSQVIIDFASQDAAPHNFAVYTTSAALEEIYVGDTFTGPDKVQREEFDAPEDAGDYFFRCDVHPDTMTGEFIVQ